MKLDESLFEHEDQIHLNAMKERDRLEEGGFGNQLFEMQETAWSIEHSLKDEFRIDMCFDYQDNEGNGSLGWCQGTIIEISN